MNIDEIVKRISKTDGLSKTLGMKFISTPEPDTIMATMKVDERNRQPFGFLSGGASLALAENVAGIGSLALCPGRIAVGINVAAPMSSPYPRATPLPLTPSWCTREECCTHGRWTYATRRARPCAPCR